MPTIVLRDAEGADLGFVLIAGERAFAEGIHRCDLVLMKMTLPSASPLAAFIDDHRHREFSAEVESSTAGLRVCFQARSGVSVNMDLDASGAGSWSVGVVGEGACQMIVR